VVNHPKRKGLYLLNYFNKKFKARYAWATKILSMIGTPQEHPLFHNYRQLVDLATQLWGPVNQEAASERSLMKLTQTHSISEYYGEFMALAADLSWNEAPLVS
jgi:hypothetical protein